MGFKQAYQGKVSVLKKDNLAISLITEDSIALYHHGVIIAHLPAEDTDQLTRDLHEVIRNIQHDTNLLFRNIADLAYRLSVKDN